MDALRQPNIGDNVIFHDPKGRAYNALVTIVWSGNQAPLINLVIVSGDDARQDGYGRQIERHTSVQHKSAGIHGMYWRFAEEEPNPVATPTAS